MSINNEEHSLSHIEIDPPHTAKRTIIWLHGLGADGSDFVPIVPELNLPATMGVRFVFPHAPNMPITINNGYEMRAWYDIASLSIDGNVDEAGIAKSRTFVTQLIKNELARGIKTENIILAGFSQGAVIALATGLCYPQRLGGLLALSGYLSLTEEALQNAGTANQHTPLFIGHGTDDPVVPYALGQSAYTRLKQKGYTVEWNSYPMSHSVCAAEISDIGQWIKTVWK